MKAKLQWLAAGIICLSPGFLFSQGSTIEYQTGTAIDVTAGADICADNITINGTYSGGGTKCNSALPVELASFSAEANEISVILKWQTATEVNNYGFEVERAEDRRQKPEDGSQSTIVKRQWGKVGFVGGHGNSNSIKNYSFKDENISSGKYLYRIKQLDNDGAFKYSDEIEVEINTPSKFALEQNYPNPFNPSTTISYQLSADSHVLLKVYDVLGKEVKTLVNENKKAGTYVVNFDASGLGSGVFIYKLFAGNYHQERKMIMLK